jgi:hypothetical protein
MADLSVELMHRIRVLERELETIFEKKEKEFGYSWQEGKAQFEKEVTAAHRRLKRHLVRYVLQSRAMVVLTAPVIYSVLLPFLLVDLFMTTYQAICFPIYGIPKVKRSSHLVFDRGRLKYLNLLERLNCLYCSYANGVCAYVTEIAARTEQHWCPIKHARRLASPHSRYFNFLDYGDADRYSHQIESVRKDFSDLQDTTPSDQDGDT